MDPLTNTATASYILLSKHAKEADVLNSDKKVRELRKELDKKLRSEFKNLENVQRKTIAEAAKKFLD